MRLYALIVAGGSGKRMGTEIPKQFLELERKPILMHTIERFHSFNRDIEIIVVLPENQIKFWEELKAKHSFKIPHKIVIGGSARFYSVKNGLSHINTPGLVAIHDGVRPCVSIETIKKCFDTAEKKGSAIPCLIPIDSIRIEKDQKNIPISRSDVKMIQTPQVFKVELIKKAYLQEYDPEFTDDATVLEKIGIPVNLVEGNRENIKITDTFDLLICSQILPAIS